MDDAQWNAIEKNMSGLCDAIEADMFLCFMLLNRVLSNAECDIISRESPSNGLRVLKSFDVLRSKKGSWEATIEFLQKHEFVDVAAKLNLSAGRMANSVMLQLDSLQDGQSSLDWRQFIRDVNDFYLGDYRIVESFDVDGDSDLIESVWVDLQLEGSREPIGHYGEIFAQMRAKNCRLAIVRGQPGSGKTTLVKKIAYDWAKEAKNEIFDLILVVPLRDVLSKSDLLEMAVGFHLGNDDDYEAKRICTDLRREKLKILLILDGLDEFRMPPDSHLAKIFGSAPNSFNIVRTKPVRLNFDLLVTSRPFACQLIHANIPIIKYEIVGLREDKLVEFVTKKCRMPKGKIRAIEYFTRSESLKEIASNPLLLTLICFLSDRNESIPSTLTKLYGTFVHRMLIRAARKNAVGKNFDPSNWQQSELLKNLGSLALLGVIENQFQFNQDKMQMCHVSREDFHSGLLLYRSDPVGLALKSDFPHRSIQDFLAAFYAVHYWGDKTLMEATGWPNDIWPIAYADLIPQTKVEWLVARLIPTETFFCRFLFGLISGRSDFSNRYRLMAGEIFGGLAAFRSNPFLFILVGSDLVDCSDEENFAAGQISNDLGDLTVDQQFLHPTVLEEKKLSYGGSRESRKFSLNSLLDLVSTNFQRGLKLVNISDQSASFGVGSPSPQCLKLLFLNADGDNFLRENVSQLLLYNQVGRMCVHIHSPLQNGFIIKQMLSQIPLVGSLEISESCHLPLLLIIAFETECPDLPKCFTLQYLRVSTTREEARGMLQRLQLATQSQLMETEGNLYNMISASIAVKNSMSNVDIWNAIIPVVPQV